MRAGVFEIVPDAEGNDPPFSEVAAELEPSEIQFPALRHEPAFQRRGNQLWLIVESFDPGQSRAEQAELRLRTVYLARARFVLLTVSSRHSASAIASPVAHGFAFISIHPGGSLAGKESIEATSIRSYSSTMTGSFRLRTGCCLFGMYF